jgi:hypothetical protein
MHWLTRFAILRLLGAVYAAAFLAAALQIAPLAGASGLTPVGLYLDHVRQVIGPGHSGFPALPTLFWIGHSDTALEACAWIGFALACAVAAGLANALALAALWFLYMSFVHVGQIWYAFGWESQLLETGFLAIFLCPLLDARPFPSRAPPVAVIWLFRWLIVRIMLGSALIKLRGDPAWRDLTALYHHFETQPLPNPFSRWFNFLPHAVLRAGVLFNFLAELVAPFLVFGPRIARTAAGIVMIAFQGVLILSGNLSFLNWLTVVPALAFLDDAFWGRVLPGALSRRAAEAAAAARPSRAMTAASWALAALVACLSARPVLNLLSPGQVMNTSFDRLDLVNTYGAFGSVGRERLNVVFEGTDAAVPDDGAPWRPYLYKGLPVDPDRRPPQVAPYQLRLDWEMWFAAMGTYRQYPFTLNLAWKLLHGDRGTLGLFAGNPFPGRPPRYIRAVLYRYRFADPRTSTGAWWTRERLGLWLPPLSAENRSLRDILRAEHWLP